MTHKKRQEVYLADLRSHHPSLTISTYANVDARSGIPDGYEVYDSVGQYEDIPDLELVAAFVGFEHFEDDYSRCDLGRHKTTVRSGWRPRTIWIRKIRK